MAPTSINANGFTPPAALSKKFWDYATAIDGAPESEKLDAFALAARYAYGLESQDFPRIEITDRLLAIAETKGISELHDTNVLQAVLAESCANAILSDPFFLPDDTPDRSKSVIIRPTPYRWRDPATIPPRPWLYGRLYIRHFVTATVAPGGIGKTSLSLAESIALATGRNLLGIEPRERVNSWFWNGEDPRDEMERRVAAICQQFGINKQELEGHFFLDSGHDLPIRIAEMNGMKVAILEATEQEICRQLIQNRIGSLHIDPFVSCHAVPENDNGAIDGVAKAWGRIGDRANCSISLIHHVRKGAPGQGELTVEDARGATPLIYAARIARVLNPMSEKEAKQAGIDAKIRREFFRTDNGKTNMAPPEEASWFQIVPTVIANGDSVGVVTRWSFPDAFQNVTTEHMHRVREVVRSVRYQKAPQSKDWVGYAVAEVVGLDTTKDRGLLNRILKTWFANGVLATEERFDNHRKPHLFVIPGSWNEQRAAPVQK
jgi:AAA domain